jgi:hypothetical protein
MLKLIEDAAAANCATVTKAANITDFTSSPVS